MPKPPFESNKQKNLGVFLAGLLILAPVSALAQSLGGPSQPSIEVDLSVLDELGRGPNPAAQIPPGLFPAPSQRGAGPAFNPPQPAPSVQAQQQAAPPTEVPVVRPPTATARAQNPAPARGVKETARVRAPAETALAANTAPVTQPAKEAETVPAPAAAAVEADPEPVVVEQPAPVETADELVEEQVASAEPAAESVGAAEADEPTPTAVPELNIQDGSAATTLPDAGESEPVAVEVEAIAPAAEAEEEPAVIDGVAVPEREVLDALDQQEEPETVEVAEAPAEEAAVPAPATSTQVASRGDDDTMRIIFEGTSDAISPQGDALISGLSQRLTQDPSLRLQIRAYAGGTEEAATQARRLSLDRALAVRLRLIDLGIGGSRVDIRALGNTAPDNPRDRVDITVE